MVSESDVLRRDVLAISFWRQSGDADSAVAFVADVQADEQSGDLFEDAGIFQFAAIDGTHAGKFRGKSARKLCGVRIVTANDDVAVERFVSVQKFSR